MEHRRAAAASGSHQVRRGCEACGSGARIVMHEQRFQAFDDGSGLRGYVVVACSSCGFVYGDEIPGQGRFDDYYRDLSKYDHTIDCAVSPWLQEHHARIACDLAEVIPEKQTRILDVGAAGGHLLAHFKSRGYSNLLGFDPSPFCAKIARDAYGIEVVNTPLSKMPFTEHRFDLILLSSVLEHLRDLESVLRGLIALLAPAGQIWIEVPDAERFQSAIFSPFEQFSVEHINFFTSSSLSRLALRVGLSPVHIWQRDCKINALDENPALNGLFKLGDGNDPEHTDLDGVASVQNYVYACLELESELLLDLVKRVASERSLIVWGTGSLTLHLLTVNAFCHLPIRAFVDSNPNYQGRSIGGRPVISPLEMSNYSDTILVISHAFEGEILESIRGRYKLTNRIVTFVSRTDSQR
jgi:SAM-dependent methyltransferase